MFAIYLRTSTNYQETVAQRVAIENWIASRAYPAPEVYEDAGISGTEDDRPAFQRLLSDVRAGKVKHVITFEMSRLSRDFMTFLNTLETFREYGVTVEIPGEGVQRFETATDKLLASVKAFTASQFLEDHAKRIKAGMAAAKARGVQLGAPKGHHRNLGRRKEHGADVVAKVSGLHKKGLTTRFIAETLDLSQSMVSRIIRRYCGR